MALTYDVRVWKIRPYKGKGGTTYTVRWNVAGRVWPATFKTRALADSFRAALMSAARKGEAFDTETGRPVSWKTAAQESVSWYEFAVSYVEVKWPDLAGHSRKNTVQALKVATLALLTNERGRPNDDILKKALGWAFNLNHRKTAPGSEIAAALDWLARNTRDIRDLAEPEVIRSVLNAIATKEDGKRAAPATTNRRRGALVNAFGYAIERHLLAVNPITAISWKAPKTVTVVDKRVVVNPTQARELLAAVGDVQPSGPRLVAFFAVIYYAALRPEEAIALRKPNLSLPEQGWGELLLDDALPTVGAAWTDDGDQREHRQLKQRALGETRAVPSPPELTKILHGHLGQFGTDNQGRLFRGVSGGLLASSTYTHVWAKARKTALTDEEFRSPLARRPYDLRHAAVSTWLNAGVAPTQIAEWAGQSVKVLLEIYAKCIAGQEEAARKRIEQALMEGQDLRPPDRIPWHPKHPEREADRG